jgi:hypothetical protein
MGEWQGVWTGGWHPQNVVACPKKGQKALKKLLTMLVDSVMLFTHTVSKNNKHNNTTVKMKAKTLLIAAAALAAGVMTSQAQVYSQNIVGYINIPLTNSTGYTLVANQLDLDGSGTNNGLNTVLGANLPVNSVVEVWNASKGTFKSSSWNGTSWSTDSSLFTNAMNPGGGFFLYTPTPTNLTLVGNVITGTNTYPITAGYQIVSSSGPVTGAIGTQLGYTPSLNDVVEVWNGTKGTFKANSYNGTSWGGGEPSLTVGEAIFLNAAGNTNWTQILNVQ